MSFFVKCTPVEQRPGSMEQIFLIALGFILTILLCIYLLGATFGFKLSSQEGKYFFTTAGDRISQHIQFYSGAKLATESPCKYSVPTLVIKFYVTSQQRKNLKFPSRLQYWEALFMSSVIFSVIYDVYAASEIQCVSSAFAGTDSLIELREQAMVPFHLSHRKQV